MNGFVALGAATPYGGSGPAGGSISGNWLGRLATRSDEFLDSRPPGPKGSRKLRRSGPKDLLRGANPTAARASLIAE